MCKLKICASAALLASSLLSTPTYAALVEIIVSGSTDGSDGSITYTPGSAFTVRAVYDTSVPKNPANSTFGTATGQSALVSFELTTEMGTITYLDSSRTLASFLPVVIQLRDLGNGRQRLGVDYLAGNAQPVPGAGFSSTMSNFDPGSFAFYLAGDIGTNNIFTDDIEKLFSGIDSLPDDRSLIGGLVSATGVDKNGTGVNTILYFNDFNELSYYSINTISAVPVPAAAWLFASGLIGLIGIAKRKP